MAAVKGKGRGKGRTRELKDQSRAERTPAPLKMSSERIARLAQALSLGASRTHASHYAGISYDTFNDYYARGEWLCSEQGQEEEGVGDVTKQDGASFKALPLRDQLAVQTFQATAAAESSLVVGSLAKMHQAREMLQRPQDILEAEYRRLAMRWPEHYSANRFVRQETTGAGGGPVQHQEVEPVVEVVGHALLPDNGRGEPALPEPVSTPRGHKRTRLGAPKTRWRKA